MSARGLLEDLFRVGLFAVHGASVVERSLRDDDPGGDGWTLLACGKAASAMARGARATLGARIARGRVLTRDGHGGPVEGCEVREAGHPLPDARGQAAAEEALRIATSLGRDDRLLVLLSGGASALWVAPAEGVTLEEKQQLTELLLRAGVDIAGLNTVRKHLSRIKGGRLAAAAAPATILTLAVSDVASDDPATIGSGPTAPDPTSYEDALSMLRESGVIESAPAAVLRHLESGAAGRLPESPSAGDDCFSRASYRLVATLDGALQAIERSASERGLRVRSLGRALAGEARDCAVALARELEQARSEGVDLIAAGGEPTVTVRGDGRGGRAQELALAFALEIAGQPGVAALFAGTDGSDGPTDAAGAVVDGSTVARAEPARAALERNDSNPLLDAAGALLVTGPTETNVTDVALILVRDGIG